MKACIPGLFGRRACFAKAALDWESSHLCFSYTSLYVCIGDVQTTALVLDFLNITKVDFIPMALKVSLSIINI